MDSVEFSIIVPVFHERENIRALIERLNRLDTDKKSEVIVVDGAQEKDTLGVIDGNHVIKLSCERGRAKQMNAGASAARGEVLIFLHADTELPVRALEKIRALMEKSGYVGGAFDLGIKSNRFIFRVIEKLASWRSRLNRIPYGDQALFVRREYFNRIGGYKEIPIMEDAELMRRIKKSGGHIRIFTERVMTSPRRWEKEGVVYCTFRNWTIQLLYFLGVSPDRLAKYYKHDARVPSPSPLPGGERVRVRGKTLNPKL